MKTPEEARAAWVEALRSGEYKQGKRYLANDGKYCCLGVACELAIKDGVPIERGEESGRAFYAGDDATLAFPIREWLGLDTSEGGYRRNGHDTSLAKRNDDGATFEQIATIIESAPEGLFT